MHRRASCEMINLQAAGQPGRDDNAILTRSPDRGKEPLFSNELGDVVVLDLVTERSGHAAAAGVQFNHTCAGDLREKRHRGRQHPHRLLVAMSVHQNAPGSRAQPKVEVCGKLVEEHASIGNRSRLALQNDPAIAEAEVNPLIVRHDGVVAVDALVKEQ